MKMRYVLTGDGYRGEYGTELYLLGVFDDKETAEKIAEEHNCMVTEIEANRFFPFIDAPGYDCETNDYYLGGYVE